MILIRKKVLSEKRHLQLVEITILIQLNFPINNLCYLPINNQHTIRDHLIKDTIFTKL